MTGKISPPDKGFSSAELITPCQISPFSSQVPECVKVSHYIDNNVIPSSVEFYSFSYLL